MATKLRLVSKITFIPARSLYKLPFILDSILSLNNSTIIQSKQINDIVDIPLIPYFPNKYPSYIKMSPEAMRRYIKGPNEAIEKDPKKITFRTKQINMVYKSENYQFYIKIKPKEERDISDPLTPRIDQVCPTRSFPGQIYKFKQSLISWIHKYNMRIENSKYIKKKRFI